MKQGEEGVNGDCAYLFGNSYKLFIYKLYRFSQQIDWSYIEYKFDSRKSMTKNFFFMSGFVILVSLDEFILDFSTDFK